MSNALNLVYCPDCGRHEDVRLIEMVNGGDEIKQIYTCCLCDTLFYVIRRIDDDG